MLKILTRNNTLIFLLIITVWRIFLNSTLQLHPDETYYWLWSRNLELSYFDHPPMLAYFIKLTTLFSMSEFWVRFSGILVSLSMSLLVWLLSKQLFHKDYIAAGSVILINIYPLTMSGSIIVTPDVPAFFFWSLGIYVAWRIFRTRKIYLWYILGVVFGLSLLSKYTSILLAPSIFLYMMFTEEKKWFKTIHPYLSFCIACLFFLPVLIWNSQHDWISFSFQIGHGLGGHGPSLFHVVEYIGGQMLVLSPFVWLAGMWAVSVYLFSKNNEKLFLSLTSLPIIVFFAFTSFKQAAAPNWPVLAYFTFTIALTAYFLDTSKTKIVIWITVTLITLSFSLLATLHTRFSVIPLAKISKELAITDATTWFYGWEKLAKKANEYEDVEFIITPSHTLSATMSYYLKEKVPVHVDENITRFSQYNLWKSPIKGNCKALYISLKGEALNDYKEYFALPVQTDYVTIYRNDFPIKQFRFIYGKTKPLDGFNK
ncbi:ArnT family glycosyltransferase [Elusimicrobiota bacterium]